MRESGERIFRDVSFFQTPSEGQGRDFRGKVEETIDRLSNDPASYERMEEDVYRISATRFPYSLFYLLISNRTAKILAVVHHHRQPGYWENPSDGK